MVAEPIQDISAAQPDTPKPDIAPGGEPEFVSNIPVKAPSGHQTEALANQMPSATTDPNISVEKKLQVDEDNNKPKISKPQPTVAIVTACLALILLAAGAYLKFFASS